MVRFNGHFAARTNQDVAGVGRVFKRVQVVGVVAPDGVSIKLSASHG